MIKKLQQSKHENLIAFIDKSLAHQNINCTFAKDLYCKGFVLSFNVDETLYEKENEISAIFIVLQGSVAVIDYVD